MREAKQHYKILAVVKIDNLHFRFTSVPECVYSLEKLEILLISDNQVRKIDVDGLKRLQRLATLDFTNNSIDHVPFELGLLKQIRFVLIRK